MKKHMCESANMNVCVQWPGATFIESRCPSDKHTRADKILQREQGVMGNAEKIIGWVQTWKKEEEREKKSAEKRIP